MERLNRNSASTKVVELEISNQLKIKTKLLLSAISIARKEKARQRNRNNFRFVFGRFRDISSSRLIQSTRTDIPKKCLMSQLQIN